MCFISKIQVPLKWAVFLEIDGLKKRKANRFVLLSLLSLVLCEDFVRKRWKVVVEYR